MKILQATKVCFFIAALILINSSLAMNLKKTEEKMSEKGKLANDTPCKRDQDCSHNNFCARNKEGQKVCQAKMKGLNEWCGEGDCPKEVDGQEVRCRKTGPEKSDFYCTFRLIEGSYCKWKLWGSNCRDGLKCSNNKCVKK